MTHKIDHGRINAAIARAELKTSGEITCVVKAKALDYPETPLVWAAAISLILPLVLFAVGLLPHKWIAPVLASVLGWNSIGVSGEFMLWEAILAYALLQLVLFAAVYALVSIAPIRMALTPKATRIKRVHQKALEQFYASGLYKTEGQTGVMIFCALEERFVDVIADVGIYSKVDKTLWNETVAVLLKHIKSGDLTAGFEEAVAKCGEALSAHFPPTDENPNELPDVLIEI